MHEPVASTAPPSILKIGCAPSTMTIKGISTSRVPTLGSRNTDGDRHSCTPNVASVSTAFPLFLAAARSFWRIKPTALPCSDPSSLSASSSASSSISSERALRVCTRAGGLELRPRRVLSRAMRRAASSSSQSALSKSGPREAKRATVSSASARALAPCPRLSLARLSRRRNSIGSLSFVARFGLTSRVRWATLDLGSGWADDCASPPGEVFARVRRE